MHAIWYNRTLEHTPAALDASSLETSHAVGVSHMFRIPPYSMLQYSTQLPSCPSNVLDCRKKSGSRLEASHAAGVSHMFRIPHAEEVAANSMLQYSAQLPSCPSNALDCRKPHV